MNPLFLLPVIGVAVWFFTRKGELSPELRAQYMARLAVALHTVIAKLGDATTRGRLAAEAVKDALALGLVKTAKGIESGKGLPTDEAWPGTSMSVSAYMTEYIRQRTVKPAAPGKPPAPKKYNDESPVPPFEDPRKVRAQAIAAEKSNSVAAKILHAKADNLNTLIKAAKVKSAAVATAKGIGDAASSFFSMKK